MIDKIITRTPISYLDLLSQILQLHKYIEKSVCRMNNDAVYSWIVGRPNNYPGKHIDSQARTIGSLKPLDPKSQFHIVFKALGEYIRENMEAGRGINYRNFGAFAFEVSTDLVKPAQLSNFDITKELPHQRQERMHNHGIRPCFIPDKKLQDCLIRFPGKEELEKPKSQHSVYQKGFNMIFCNAVPIAASCSLDRDIVESALTAFSRAVSDLAELGKNLDLIVGPLHMKITNKSLTYTYENAFAKRLNDTEFQQKMKKSITATKEHWENTPDKKWQQSSLSGLISKPDHERTNQLYEAGLALKIMSLDLNTTEVAISKKH